MKKIFLAIAMVSLAFSAHASDQAALTRCLAAWRTSA